MGINYQPLAATATFRRTNSSQRRPTDRAEIVVRTWIVPTIAAACETYPELDVADVLDRCVAALTERLREAFRAERQQLIEEIRIRLR
jgi:hypothetical protein